MDIDDSLEPIRDGRSMIRFALPTMAVMAIISTYSIIDGALVSNMIGTDGLAGLNIVMPAGSFLTAMGFMLATGGSAYIANKLGEGRVDDARRSFSGITALTLILSLIICGIGLLFCEELVELLGADDSLRGYSEDYLYTCMWVGPIFVLQYLSTQFLIVAGRPNLSLIASILGGVTNIVLDIVFMGPLDMGISGAALASGFGSAIPVIIATAFFVMKEDSPLRYVHPSFDGRMFAKVCSNGASEMVSELSGAVTTLLFNLTMMHYLGPDGVSSITMLLYVQFLALSLIIGYSMGVAPVMSYNHGADRRDVMSTLFRTSMKLVMVISVAIFLIMELFNEVVISLFAGDSEMVMEIATHGATIFSFAFLFMGFNCYVSSLFTSLSNGLLSAIVSFLRGLCLLAPMIILLPMVMGADGIWVAVPVTEIVTVMISAFLVIRMGPRYGYLKKRTEKGLTSS